MDLNQPELSLSLMRKWLRATTWQILRYWKTLSVQMQQWWGANNNLNTATAEPKINKILLTKSKMRTQKRKGNQNTRRRTPLKICIIIDKDRCRELTKTTSWVLALVVRITSKRETMILKKLSTTKMKTARLMTNLISKWKDKCLKNEYVCVWC